MDGDPYLIDDDLNTLGGIRGYWHVVKPCTCPPYDEEALEATEETLNHL